MNPSTEEDNQEEYEILDVTENAQQRMSAFIEYVGRVPQLISRVPHSDVAVAGLGGWAVGYLFKKVGRVAATSVGGGLCLMQLAYQSGYITINWNKLNRDMNRTQRIVDYMVNLVKIVPRYSDMWKLGY
ncbi:FUN14 domain-containing protein 1-like [Clavelina lepadiformis]|uniref:FUN14 domain-containing protein 1-like n=1 Tax=Clavelina lepadiformis TaxID=159417 RepID=UPI004042F7E1